MIVLEYIWLDNENEFRSKTKVLEQKYLENFKTLEDFQRINPINLPIWNYDGSSTGQASGNDSEIFLKPVAVFSDPFRKDLINRYNHLVLCETQDKEGRPLNNNFRRFAVEILEKYKSQEPWFGLEQEYFIMDYNTHKPLGFTYLNAQPEPQGKYYCGIGTGRVFGRDLVEKHLDHCLYAGLKIGGINAEVAPGQWEFQIGPLNNVCVGDQLIIARYILNRLAEEKGYYISYHPKPLGNTDWNGSGCHVNFSTKQMREEQNGIEYINNSLTKLNLYHNIHMKSFGDDNHKRLTGKHETSSMYHFTIGRANRGASIRIPNETIVNQKGYFEDRRPAANINPYLVCSLILQGVNDDQEFLNKEPKHIDLGYII